MKVFKNNPIKPQIVAIDDSRMILNFVESYFRNDYEITTYTSTTAALKDLAEGVVTPDCVLSDFHLGQDLTGLEFMLLFREIDPAIPVIILSGSCDINKRIACLEHGAMDFIAKPFNPKELEARINNALAISPQLKSYSHAI